MMDRPFPAYKGDEPYIFVSYSHSDSSAVFAELVWLKESGFNIWYDEGIEAGTEWREELGQAIVLSKLFLYFVTPDSVLSANCRKELNLAIEEHIPVLAVHLERTELSIGVKLTLSDRQAILKHEIPKQEYQQKLQSRISSYLDQPATKPGDSDESQPVSYRHIGYWMLAPLVVGLGLWFAYSLYQQAELRAWAHGDGMRELKRLADVMQVHDAVKLSNEIESITGESNELTELRSRVAAEFSMTSQPPGARLRIRPLSGEDEWMDLGTTPVSGVLLPRDVYEARLELDGFAPAIRIKGVPGVRSRTGVRASRFWNLSLPAPVELRPAAETPQGMVFIPGGNLPVNPFSHQTIDIGAYYIDRFEVTNAEYQPFVANGGYKNPDYWPGLEFRSGDAQLSWEEAMALFVDSTGRPGPSGWRFGSFPSDNEHLPVTGISWYEAMAYARFIGKELPTAFHWRRASMGYSERYSPAYGHMTANSNFGQVLLSVGTTTGFSQFGIRDVAGNAREWVRNEYEGKRAVLGASHVQQKYSFATIDGASPMTRDPQTGFRLIQRMQKIPEPNLDESLAATNTWDPQIEPVSDEVYRVLIEQFSYTPVLSVATTIEQVGTSRIKRERVDLAYPDSNQIQSYFVLTPKQKRPPFQPVLVFPNLDYFRLRQDTDPLKVWSGAEVIVEGGRAVILPLYYGMNERYSGFTEMEGDAQAGYLREAVVTWRQEIGQVIDHLETRRDMDTSRLVAWGVSYGAVLGLPALAAEPRFKGMLLMFGGLLPDKLPAIASAVNYLPRITVPVLMVNGRFDATFPHGTSQQSLFDHLGTPAELKEWYVYEGGHSTYEGELEAGVILKSVNWLESRFGPTERTD